MELASMTIQSIETENLTNTYNLANKLKFELKFDINDNSEKILLYMPHVAICCNCCSIPPLTDYANNRIFASLNKRIMRTSKGYTCTLDKLKRDNSELTLKTNLKAPLTKKVGLCV